MNNESYPMLGDKPVGSQNKKAWIVPIDNFKPIIPRDYFVTTGEAIVKVDMLIEHTQALLHNLNAFRKSLVSTKNDAKYLETCWEDGKLLVKQKNAKKKIKNDK